jgi:pantoate--beta-alanine ligase
MLIIKEKKTLVRYLEKLQMEGRPPSFVPTMGALHRGHIALVEKARAESRPVICSIFVNPTQFNDPKDFQKYPVTLEDDIAQLEAADTDILFLPSVAGLYPGGTTGLEQYDLGYLESVLEGKFRPGHFQGVCQVMNRLLAAVGPCKLFMGQKDYQQCMVVQRLIQLKNLPVELIACATVREHDGLAMSSRNKRLNPTERQNAVGIFRALQSMKQNMHAGDLGNLKKQASLILEQHNFRIDYVEIANANNLELRSEWDGKETLIALIAAFQNEVRLIDNMPITP